MNSNLNTLPSNKTKDIELTFLNICFSGFLGSMYFITGHISSLIAISFFTAACMVEIVVFRNILRTTPNILNTLVFLSIIAIWATISLYLYAGFARIGDAIANTVLIAIFLFFIRYLTGRRSLQAILLVIAVFATVNAASSLVVHVIAPDPEALGRLVPLGRGGNSIPGAGGLAAGLIALAAASFERRDWSKAGKILAVAAASLMAFALVRTESRGPILALAAALSFGFLLRNNKKWITIAIACLTVWIVIASIVMLQEPIRQLLCSHSAADFCRPPNRNDVWEKAFKLILQHPLFGVSPVFRFDSKWISHPHNGLFGLTMFYGVPMLIAVLSAFAWLAKLASQLANKKQKFYAIASLTFILGYMGSDMSNIFSYINMHYVFAWMPLFLLITLSGDRAETTLPQT